MLFSALNVTKGLKLSIITQNIVQIVISKNVLLFHIFFAADKEKQIVRCVILFAIVHNTTNELRSQYITQIYQYITQT